MCSSRLEMRIIRIMKASAIALLFAAPLLAQEAADIAIDGDFADWADIPVAIEDPEDMTPANIHGDYKSIKVASTDTTFYALQTVFGDAAPADAFRYYYHILIDADGDASTGVPNDSYEGTPTGVGDVVGSDFYIQIGRNAGADDGISVTHLESGEVVLEDFAWMNSGDSLELAVDFDVLVVPAAFDIGAVFQPGSTIRIAAFQEGNADGWGPIDWTEPAEHVIGQLFAVEPRGKATTTWSKIKAAAEGA
jgi:hypothetical protein